MADGTKEAETMAEQGVREEAKRLVDLCRQELQKMSLLKNMTDEEVTWLALWNACDQNSLDVIRVLVREYGVDPCSKSPVAIQQSIPLLHAVSRDHVEVVRLLIAELGANVDLIVDVGGIQRSPLTMAIGQQQMGMITLLIELGANVNLCRTVEGCPLKVHPLTAAAFEGNDEIARLLVQNGADLNLRGALSPLRFCHTVEMAMLMMDLGADPHWVYEDQEDMPCFNIFGLTYYDSEPVVMAVMGREWGKGREVDICGQAARTPPGWVQEWCGERGISLEPTWAVKRR